MSNSLTIYRMGTANTYDNARQNLNVRQNILSGLQENLTSGKRVIRASDDPVAAAQAERALTRINRIQTEQRNAVGVLAVDHLGELLTQALQLVGVGLAVFGFERAAARGHHDLAHVLHQLHGVAQRRFGLGHGVALHFKRALLGLDACDAGERALGLGGGHRVVAGAHHALARGQVVLQAHQAGMALTQVAQGVVVHVRGTDAHECVAHVSAPCAGQRPMLEIRLSKTFCAIWIILAEAW